MSIDHKYLSSVPFIRTTKDDWIVPEDGIIPELKVNMPIISCIGTSRDGKSTLLNLYIRWLVQYKLILEKSKLKQYLNSIGTKNAKDFSPFVSMQTDEVVTNGLSYYMVDNECMLIDCQGMQLKNAKHDHYLMLLTYLFSNVIVFTVRERLDLQVFNNCLAVFSFLSEIPENNRRKDKPILLIRIKDFQNYGSLKKDPNYLNKLIENWLEPSGDQYDNIKNAFKQIFNIQIITTSRPAVLTENGEFLTNEPDFFKENPSFLTICEKIYELTLTNNNMNQMLKSKQSIIDLITSLKSNNEIDWRKLNLYHQLIENKLLKYIQTELLFTGNVFTDRTIIDKMNGLLSGSTLYVQRESAINEKFDHIYKVQFVDIPKNILDEIFNEKYKQFMDIVMEAKTKNHLLADNIVKPGYDKYIKEFNDQQNSHFLVKQIMVLFRNKKDNFITNISNIDHIIKNKYVDLMNKEEIELKAKQQKINILNDKHGALIYDHIIKYNIKHNIYSFIYKSIDGAIERHDYNREIQTDINECLKKISDDILNIYKTNDVTYCLNSKDKTIITSAGKLNMDEQTLKKHLPDDKFFKSKEFIDAYWIRKRDLLNKMKIIIGNPVKRNVQNLEYYDIYTIQLCAYNFYNNNQPSFHYFQMMAEFYEETSFIENAHKFSKLLTPKSVTIDKTNDIHTIIKINYKIDIMNERTIPGSNDNILNLYFNRMIYDKWSEYIISFCLGNNITLSMVTL